MSLTFTTPEPLRFPKFERANHHLEDLDKAVTDWLNSDGYRSFLQRDANIAGNYVLTVECDPTPLESVSLIIGDILQNFRSGLDNIVFDLATRHAGKSLSERFERDCQFPIIGDISKKGVPGSGPHMWASNREKWVGAVSPEAQSVIERLQPYHRGSNYASHPLWVLNELVNRDKHRAIAVAVATVSGLGLFPDSLTNCRFRQGGQYIAMPDTAVVKGKTPVASIPLDVIDPDKEMKVQVRPTVKVVFNGVLSGTVDVKGALWEIGRYITYDVIRMLEPELRRA